MNLKKKFINNEIEKEIEKLEEEIEEIDIEDIHQNYMLM